MKEYLIEENDSDQRLDRFLKKIFPHIPKNLIYKFNRKNKIKIIQQNSWENLSKIWQYNKTIQAKKQHHQYKLQTWDKVQVYLSDTEIKELSQDIAKKNLYPLQKNEQLLGDTIIFEDENLLIINKNPWINVHPWNHKTHEVSLIQQVDDYYRYDKKLFSMTFKPSLIHRIDRDTSGIIMIAKNKISLTKLINDFKSSSTRYSLAEWNKKRQNSITKTYYALVAWKLSRNTWSIKKNILHIKDAMHQNKVQISQKWQTAITHYKVLKEFYITTPKGKQVISGLEITLETGRMHQIRIHLSHIGNPIIWDKTYGDKQLNAYFIKNYSLYRQMLHAWKITFIHPKTHKKIHITADLKNDMKEFISKIS